MACSLQALLNVIKNATTREQPARNVEDLEEEEEELEKEGNVLTSTGNTEGTPTLTATGTSSNGDSNVGGLRRSTRAASKTPADPNISKGATVPTPCWNSIPSSNSRKRKISSSLNPEPQTSKRPACHLGDDVSQNSIDLRSNSDSALPSDFPLDHQRSRSSNDNHLSSEDKDFNSSQSNKTIKSNLLDRITSTSQDLNHSFVRFTLNERHLSIPVSTSDHHERQDQLTKKFFTNINTSYSHTLDSIAKQITLPLGNCHYYTYFTS
ncbi:hypothetical protein PSTG_08382 [Puccinia striiformis f. sp. tritici PST-78]|uniref:Uncharacterized protein n=1 Tax=Puccinia striiformis f. sp. tritici PST-78 TaxID=1165861 RepID=A0A0L0VG81_9BASI|nr:hypothetical protein PSTG_08382 [Puccinia striiformis f. sp. tritici PST-78]